jgi:hypothetical protein
VAGPLQPYRSFTSDEIIVLLDDSSGDSDIVESGSASAESEIDYA